MHSCAYILTGTQTYIGYYWESERKSESERKKQDREEKVRGGMVRKMEKEGNEKMLNERVHMVCKWPITYIGLLVISPLLSLLATVDIGKSQKPGLLLSREDEMRNNLSVVFTVHCNTTLVVWLSKYCTHKATHPHTHKYVAAYAREHTAIRI